MGQGSALPGREHRVHRSTHMCLRWLLPICSLHTRVQQELLLQSTQPRDDVLHRSRFVAPIGRVSDSRNHPDLLQFSPDHRLHPLCRLGRARCLQVASPLGKHHQLVHVRGMRGLGPGRICPSSLFHSPPPEAVAAWKPLAFKNTCRNGRGEGKNGIC